MGADGVLRIVLDVVLILLAGLAIWGVVEVVRTARSARALADDLDRRLVPLIEKADRTLDNVNAEMARVDDIVSQIEEVSDAAASTTRAARDIVNAPVSAVSGVAEGLRRFLTVMLGRRV